MTTPGFVLVNFLLSFNDAGDQLRRYFDIKEAAL
jgi:ABC-type dipeptide/oligopeptide/nickel transport system permease subunit